MKIRAYIYVSGRVQGVFFRSRTRDEAIKYDIRGWARNLPDGRVEIICEGEKKNVDRLIEFCKIGPKLAKVDKVEIIWEDYKSEFENFKIR